MAFDSDPALKVINNALPSLQDALTQSMANAGWPDEVSKQVKVKFVGGSVVIDIPPSLRDEVLNLEYGTFDSTPKPALRRFAPERDRIISEQLTADLPDLVNSYIQREVS